MGPITPDPLHPEDATARIDYDSREINVQLIADEQPLTVTLELAAEVVKYLSELDAGAKQVIADDLWARHGSSDFGESTDPGKGLPPEVPDLEQVAKEFMKRMSLATISVTGGSTVEFYYDEAGLFGGRAVIVIFRDGIDLSSTRAELFG